MDGQTLELSPLVAFLLGLVQGLTEFLPVSSSAHLIFFSWVLDGKTLPLTLNLAFHFGTLIAVLIYFWQDWLALLKSMLQLVKTPKQRTFETHVLLPALLIGTVPAGVIGVLWEHQIENYFHHPLSLVAPLVVIGVLVWLVDRYLPQDKKLQDLKIKDGFLVGVGQACALIPGFSRSGSTILVARLLKYNRADAAKFSFLLGTPAMGGAVLLHLKDLKHVTFNPAFFIGIATSAAVGVLAIRFFIGFLAKYGFAAFAIYRAAFALLVFLTVKGVFL